jgi:capsular exopolysaccharide synthesis family protein
MTESPNFSEVQAPMPPAQNETSLGEMVAHYWRLLRRYYWILIIAVVVAVAAAFFYTQRQPKVFKASSKIIFHQKRGSVFGRNIEQVELMDPGNKWEFETFWNSQREVLRSRWFAERIVKREGLLDREGFLKPKQDGTERTSEEKMDAAIARVQNVSSIGLQRDSRVGIISVETQDPELSADIANAMSEEYVDYTREFQSGGLRKIVDWFDSYVASKKEELEKAQNELQKYKQRHNILSMSYEDRQNQSVKNMQSVSEQLLDVRAELAREEALLEQIREMESGEQDLTVVAGLLDNRATKTGVTSPIEEALKRRAELREELSKLETRYLDQHPQVKEVEQQLVTVNEHIQSEIDRSRAEVRNSVSALRKTESKLEQELDKYRQQLFQLNDLGVEYSQLKNRADNLEQLYETVLTRSSELNINSLYEPRDIQVLERAQPPASPVRPILPLNLALGLLAGLGLGIGTTVLIDSLDTTIKREDDVTDLTDKPILTTLPRIHKDVLAGLETIGETPADTITYTAPKSSYAEGMKTLRTNLTFMSPDQPPKTVLVTSPGPSEGKTITSVNMAIAMAQSGLRTVIVDGDMRRPRLHKAMGLDNELGLSSIIKGDATVDDAVQTTFTENLHAVSCGDVPPNPTEMLHSEKFQDLVGELAERYDRVVFDSPPLGAVSDALIISNEVDGLVLVLKFAKTRREMLRRSLDQMRAIGAPLMGVVLNEISYEVGGYYGYSYYGSYSYYGEDERESPKMAS